MALIACRRSRGSPSPRALLSDIERDPLAVAASVVEASAVDLGPAARESQGDGRTGARGRARDQRHLARKSIPLSHAA
jgi:hypothetical protein